LGLAFSLSPLEVSVKKRLTFGFLPWVAAAAICTGSGFARSQDAGTLVPDDGSVLIGNAAEIADETDADACTRTVQCYRWVTEMQDVNVTEWSKEQRERSYTVTKRVPRTEERSRNYTVMVPETRTKTVDFTVMNSVPEKRTADYTVRVPYTESIEKSYTVHVPV